MMSKQFSQNKQLAPTPKSPKVKNSNSGTNMSLKPIPTPEEKVLMLAKARNLDAKTSRINRTQ
jgi:hypothetical protein